jgi:hypothetical protein
MIGSFPERLSKWKSYTTRIKPERLRELIAELTIDLHILALILTKSALYFTTGTLITQRTIPTEK